MMFERGYQVWLAVEDRMVVTKESILSGDSDQLGTLLSVHFIECGEESKKNIDKEQRLAISNAIHAGESVSIQHWNH